MPIEAPIQISNDFVPDEAKQEINNEGQMDMPDFNSNMMTNGQNEHYGGSLNGQTGDNRGTRMDVAVEQDPGGIGIKEDG